MSPRKPRPVVQISATDLAALLKPILAIIPKPGYELPVLTAVRLSVRDGWLLAVGTDRYRVGWSRHKLATPPKNWTALIAGTDLKSLLPMVRGAELTLTVDGSAVAVQADGGKFAALTLSIPLHPGPYPALDSMGAGFVADQESRAVSVLVNPDYLADFRAARRGREPMKMWTVEGNRGDVILCAVGDHFLGALMQMRPSEEPPVPAPWAPMFSDEAP